MNTPLLRAVSGGEPSDEELAALVAVVASRGCDAPDSARSLREPLSPWVASGLVKGTRTRA